jgi:hypothetical protein
VVRQEADGVTATTTPVRPERAASAAHAARAGRTRRGRQRHSLILSLPMTVMLLYALLPLFWLVINSAKTLGALFSTFGLWFGGPFALWSNIHQVLTYDNGIFVRWLANTLLYVVVGAGGATFLATLAGYGLATGAARASPPPSPPRAWPSWPASRPAAQAAQAVPPGRAARPAPAAAVPAPARARARPPSRQRCSSRPR